MTDLSAFAGKLALVAGAGDGIGAMLAKGFAGAGVRVAVQDIRAEAAVRVAGEIGPLAFPLVFDVSDRSAAVQAAEQLRRRGEALNLDQCGRRRRIADHDGQPARHPVGVCGERAGAGLDGVGVGPMLAGAGGARHLGVTASSIALWPRKSPTLSMRRQSMRR